MLTQEQVEKILLETNPVLNSRTLAFGAAISNAAYAAGMLAGEAKKMEQEFTVTAGCGNSGRILPNGTIAIGGG